MSVQENPQNFTSSTSQSIDETEVNAKAPKSMVAGNERIKILKHSLHHRNGVSRTPTPGAEIAIRNISDTTISNVVFEAIFYDSDENIVDIVKHNEIELKPNTSRAFAILCSKEGVNRTKSYKIRISRMTMSDEEKVQLRQHKIRTTEAGEEEVTGIVKNISNENSSAVLVATFFDRGREKIGTKAILMRDIEPDKYKQFKFIFRPAEGDIVMTYSLNVVSEIEEC